MNSDVVYGPVSNRPWCPTIEVRTTGYRTFEARTRGGLHSAIGSTAEEAVGNLRKRLPPHEEPVVMNIPVPSPFPQRFAWERTIE